MTAPSGQLEAGEVTVSEEHRKAAHQLLLDGFGWRESTVKVGAFAIETLARAFAERDAAAERRGAEREREACAEEAEAYTFAGPFTQEGIAKAIRARKP